MFSMLIVLQLSNHFPVQKIKNRVAMQTYVDREIIANSTQLINSARDRVFRTTAVAIANNAARDIIINNTRNDALIEMLNESNVFLHAKVDDEAEVYNYVDCEFRNASQRLVFEVEADLQALGISELWMDCSLSNNAGRMFASLNGILKNVTLLAMWAVVSTEEDPLNTTLAAPSTRFLASELAKYADSGHQHEDVLNLTDTPILNSSNEKTFYASEQSDEQLVSALLIYKLLENKLNATVNNEGKLLYVEETRVAYNVPNENYTNTWKLPTEAKVNSMIEDANHVKHSELRSMVEF